jgi:hypothetical protein
LEAPPDHVDVILPNLLGGQLVPSLVPDRDPDILVPHFPYLEFDPRHLQQASGLPPYFLHQRVLAASEAETRGYCPLNWQDLEVHPEGKPQKGALRIVNGEPQDLTKPQTAEERRYLHWLIDMEKIHSGSGQFNADLLKPLAKGDTKVIARVKLQSGLLSTDQVSSKVFEFHPVGSASNWNENKGWRQVVAVQLALEFEVEHEVKILLTGFDESRSRLIFAPPADKLYDDVTVVIHNRELDPLLDFTMPAAPQSPTTASEHYDPDFKVFYELSTRKPTNSWPLPHGPSGTGGGDHRPCSPAGFAGVSRGGTE